MFIVFISTHFIMSLFKPKKRVSATTVTAKKVLSKPIDASLILKIDRRLLEEIFGKDIYEKLEEILNVLSEETLKIRQALHKLTGKHDLFLTLSEGHIYMNLFGSRIVSYPDLEDYYFAFEHWAEIKEFLKFKLQEALKNREEMIKTTTKAVEKMLGGIDTYEEVYDKLLDYTDTTSIFEEMEEE